MHFSPNTNEMKLEKIRRVISKVTFASSNMENCVGCESIEIFSSFFSIYIFRTFLVRLESRKLG